MLVAADAEAAPKPDVSDLEPQTIEVTAHRIDALDPADPERTRFGKLIWLGGLVLSSDSPWFGGYSGLALDADGEHLVAISDSGSWLMARLTRAGGRLQGLADVRIGPLLGMKGTVPGKDRERDSEGIALIEGSLAKGDVLISYEQAIRIAKHAISDEGVGPALELLPLPSEAKHLSANKSLESVAMLKAGPNKGAVVTFAEHKRSSDGHHIGWLLKGKATHQLLLADNDRMDISDIAALPDGGLIVLERDFSWAEGLHVRVERVAAEDIDPDKVMTGDTLLQGDLSYEIDNLEGVTVSPAADGGLILTLISDDNFSVLQRTLLLQLELPAAKETAQ